MMSLLGSYAADCRSQMNVAYVGSLGPNGRGDGKGNQASGAAVDHVSSACLHHHSQSRVVTRAHDGRANRLRAGDIWAYMQPWHAAARSWSLCRLARAATIPIPGTNLGPCPSLLFPPAVGDHQHHHFVVNKRWKFALKHCAVRYQADVGRHASTAPRPNAGLQTLTLGQWGCITCCLLPPVLRRVHC